MLQELQGTLTRGSPRKQTFSRLSNKYFFFLTSMHEDVWVKYGTTHLICQNLLIQSYKKSKFEPL